MNKKFKKVVVEVHLCPVCGKPVEEGKGVWAWKKGEEGRDFHLKCYVKALKDGKR